MRQRHILLSTIGMLAVSTLARANIELPMGAITGCPFVHNDSYDLGPLLETLKTQLAAELENKNNCKQAIQSIVSNLSPLQDFYKTIDPTTKQKITKSIYAGALSSLATRKLRLEMLGETASTEYQLLLNQISIIESSNLANEVDLASLPSTNRESTEAYYRSQLLSYTSNIIGAFNATARNNPNCIGSMGGWSSALSAVLGGFSLATGLGVNPTAQIVGAALETTAQLISLLQDSKVRASYNELVRLKNQKTLACTYYAIKKASCEYQRAYSISQDSGYLRQYIKGQFKDGKTGEYERFFVNQGQIQEIGGVFSLIAQMGSPLTLDQTILNSYLTAKAVDFVALGPPPASNASEDVIKQWLFRAKAFGVLFSEVSYQTGSPVTLKLQEQLSTAIDDIDAKQRTIIVAEQITRANLSFLDLRRRLSSDFPNARANAIEIRDYFVKLKNDALIDSRDKGTIDASVHLLNRLLDFLNVAIVNDGKENDQYEKEVVSRGGDIFEELAKGAVAQLTKQSVLALSGKGIDRMNWSFGVIQNAYMNRDLTLNLPKSERFSEYRRNRNALSDVIANYQVFSGSGTTFRNEEFTKSISVFENAFKDEMLRSLDFSIKNRGGIQELQGETAAHLCALYSPSLEKMSRAGLFGKNRAAKILSLCHENYKQLALNKLVSDQSFTIDYGNECTYFDYSRVIEIENLIARLITP